MYILKENFIVNGDDACIPFNEDNYRFRKFVEEGNALANPLVWVDGKPIPDGEFLISEAIDIDSLKLAATQEINNFAESVRLKYVTAGAGQAMTYQQKFEEAVAYIAAGRPSDASSYVFISTEAAARNISVDDMADVIVVTRQQWAIVGSQIEKERIVGNSAVMNSETVSELNNAKETAIAALSVF